jgi:hypothetical protein
MEGGAVGHNFERDQPRDHPCQVCVIWFWGFRGEDLNVIFYQNMPNMAMSSLTYIYILGISVRFFSASLFRL